MKTKIIIALIVVVFLGYCGVEINKSGVIESSQKSDGLTISLASEVASPSDKSNVVDLTQKTQSAQKSQLDLTGLSAKTEVSRVVTLGSIDKDSDFLFELDITNDGAGIEYARLRDFSSRTNKKEPLVALAPVDDYDGSRKISLASSRLTFIDQAKSAPIGKLGWQIGDKKVASDGSESVELRATLFTDKIGNVVEIIKTFRVVPNQDYIECDIKCENLSSDQLNLSFDLQSPVGFAKEAVRSDGRKTTVAYEYRGEIESDRFGLVNLRKYKIGSINGDKKSYEKMVFDRPLDSKVIWASTANKYFGAILWLQPGEITTETLLVDRGEYYDSKLRKGFDAKNQPKTDGSENIGFTMQLYGVHLPAGESKTYNFNMYLGPKEKGIFEDNPIYNKLGFIQAIDFRMCLGNLFRPLSFWILGFMKILHVVIPNYGLVIIVLVLIVRALLHPLTKKGQVSMMNMSKLAPKMEALKAKYANNKPELNRRMMELYRENGASPMLGILPMLIQMPIWVALYSAIYASIDLRGAEFLPVWITDLSSPDALFHFKAFTIPLLGIQIDSFNLLPVLLGVAMYLQQKMMPSASASTTSNPQMAQQQKIMQIMMPIMMFVFLYKAPSGLNLYIMSSVFGGVIEQKIIRKHLKEKQELESIGKIPVTKKTGGKAKKKKPKPFYKNGM